MKKHAIQRPPAEELYQQELKQLQDWDPGPVPPGWQLSPLATEKFILGDDDMNISRKFVACGELVTRIIISLATTRGLMLIGPPGTAKSWLSELIACAISGSSGLTVQGGAITEMSQLLYGWNPAILKQRGPCAEAIIPGPIYRGMKEGKLVRFEELSRCPQPVQDGLLSVLSERQIQIPELSGKDSILFAREGFNILATANSIDAGVNQMSAALKRRLNFERIEPIDDIHEEIAVIQREIRLMNQHSGIEVALDDDIVTALVTIFHELRNGETLDGRSTDRLAVAVLSTAEAVSVAHALCIHAFYYRKGMIEPADLLRFIVGAALKDNPDDKRRLKHYFDTEIARKDGTLWQTLYQQRQLL